MTALSHWLVQICASNGPKLPSDVWVLGYEKSNILMQEETEKEIKQCQEIP